MVTLCTIGNSGRPVVVVTDACAFTFIVAQETVGGVIAAAEMVLYIFVAAFSANVAAAFCTERNPLIVRMGDVPDFTLIATG